MTASFSASCGRSSFAPICRARSIRRKRRASPSGRAPTIRKSSSGWTRTTKRAKRRRTALLLERIVTRPAQLFFLELQILPRRRVAHFSFIDGLGQLAGQVRVDPLVDDHVGAEVAQVEAGGRADAV